jgi:hypothetical protein
MNGGMEATENILDRLKSLERAFSPANVAAVAFHLGDQASLSLDNRFAVRQMPLNRLQAVARPAGIRSRDSPGTVERMVMVAFSPSPLKKAATPYKSNSCSSGVIQRGPRPN